MPWRWEVSEFGWVVDVPLEMGVSKNNGTPKMDGENNGKPY